jgi:hypothetical protein
MPTPQQHEIQVQDNRRLLQALWQNRRSAFPDWVVTVAFYTAVHLVEGYLGRPAFNGGKGYHSIDHSARNGFVSMVTELKAINGDYQELYNRSLDSRYRCAPAKWNTAQVEHVLAALERVERHIRGLP